VHPAVHATRPRAERARRWRPRFSRLVRERPVAGDFATLFADVGEVPPGLARFFRVSFDPSVTTVAALAARLGVRPSTLMSRFWRAGLPSPKQYLLYARFVRAAYLLEAPRATASAVALRLNASSPQAFHRTVRTALGMTLSEFRVQYRGEAMLARFRDALITPYRDTLRTFDPVRAARSTPGDRAPEGRPRAGGGPEGRRLAERAVVPVIATGRVHDDATRESPVARVHRVGVGAASVEDLLAVIAGARGDRAPAEGAGRAVWEHAERSLHRIAQMPIDWLARHPAVGWARAAAVHAALELGRRARAERIPPGTPIRSAATVFALLGPALEDRPQREAHVLLLDRGARLARTVFLTRGLLDAVILSPREAFYDALHAGAAGIILVHNCPCGDPEITPADRAMTDTLAAAGQLLGVPLLDHVVVARGGYVSFAERGLLAPCGADCVVRAGEGRDRIVRPRLVRGYSDSGARRSSGTACLGRATRCARSATRRSSPSPRPPALTLRGR
jgi:DNA repair protein RadC